MSAEPAYGVFISYAGEDVFIARMLARMIEQAGATAYFFTRDGQPGGVIDDEIRKAAARSHEALFVLTPESIERTYVIVEIGMFLMRRTPMTGLLHRLDARTSQTTSDLPAELKRRNLLALDDAETYIDAMTARMAARRPKKTR